MLRIGFNARALCGPHPRGFSRYTAGLVRALARIAGVEPVLFCDAPIHPVHDVGHLECVIHVRRPTYVWQHVWLPAELRRRSIDLFHAPAHWGFPALATVPCVCTIHDLADRELPREAPVRRDLRHVAEEWLAVRRAARILTVSAWSAESIRRHLHVPPDRIAVTVEGSDLRPATEADLVRFRTAHRIDRPFVVHVGGHEARKNVDALLAAAAMLPCEARPLLVFVGSDAVSGGRLHTAAAARGVGADVRMLGPLSDTELAAAYTGAVATVIPSWVEGFGLPIVEAMHCGTPSIVAHAAALPEVAGDAGLTFPPDRPEVLAAHLRVLAARPELASELREKASARATLFTWERAAAQVVDVYESVLARSR
jgi:glycosyltransferase involved in cell wall biosynthesis